MFEQYYVPLVFNKLSQVVIFGIAVCLCAISFMACFKLKLGLNQNVGFVNGSDLYNYFEVLFRINTFFFSPLNKNDSDADLFQKPYLEMLYWVSVSNRSPKITM